MITTRRSSDGMRETISNSNNSSVAVLERETPVSYKEFVAPSKVEEDIEQARARRRENLDKILNYDRYSTVVEEPVKEVENASQVVETAVQEDDIRPTSTTMQFGDGDINQMYEEMRAGSTEKASYHLNGKGKLVVALYSLLVAVVMTLIIINSGLISSFNKEYQASVEELNGLMTEYAQIESKIESVSNNDYVIELAENQYGMVKNG